MAGLPETCLNSGSAPLVRGCINPWLRDAGPRASRLLRNAARLLKKHAHNGACGPVRFPPNDGQHGKLKSLVLNRNSRRPKTKKPNPSPD